MQNGETVPGLHPVIVNTSSAEAVVKRALTAARLSLTHDICLSPEINTAKNVPFFTRKMMVFITWDGCWFLSRAASSTDAGLV